MNTNMTEFMWFSKKSLHPGSLDESSLIIERVQGLSIENTACLLAASRLYQVTFV